MSKDVQSRHPRAHMRQQSSTRHQFDENVSTYHSTKSSLTHGPVQRGHTNVFGGRGRILPLQTDISLPSGPSASMGPLSHPAPCKGQFFQPCTQSQPARLAMPLGVLLEKPFADLTGLAMGISMPPLILGTSPPHHQSGWAAQPTVQAPQGTDAESVAGSASEQRK